jgi:hypothetical protein
VVNLVLKVEVEECGVLKRERRACGGHSGGGGYVRNKKHNTTNGFHYSMIVDLREQHRC